MKNMLQEIFLKRGKLFLTFLGVAVTASALLFLYQTGVEAHAPDLSITQVNGQTTSDTVTITTEVFPITVDVTVAVNHEVKALSVKDLALFVNDVQEGSLIQPSQDLCGNDAACAITMPWSISQAGDYTLYVSAYHGNKDDLDDSSVSATVQIVV